MGNQFAETEHFAISAYRLFLFFLGGSEAVCEKGLNGHHVGVFKLPNTSVFMNKSIYLKIHKYFMLVYWICPPAPYWYQFAVVSEIKRVLERTNKDKMAIAAGTARPQSSIRKIKVS